MYDDEPLGVSLTDRIKMINRRFNREEAKNESVAEDSMIEVSKNNEAPVEKLTYHEDVEEEPIALLPNGYEELSKKVDDLTTEIKKMNKHINSIVKYIKKVEK